MDTHALSSGFHMVFFWPLFLFVCFLFFYLIFFLSLSLFFEFLYLYSLNFFNRILSTFVSHLNLWLTSGWIHFMYTRKKRKKFATNLIKVEFFWRRKKEAFFEWNIHSVFPMLILWLMILSKRFFCRGARTHARNKKKNLKSRGEWIGK